jgi:hypothetical protein
MLLAADRVDSVESAVRSAASERPDVMLPTGVRSEASAHGVSSRLGRRRTDLNHQWLDPLVVAAPRVLAVVVAAAILRRVRRA